jgi:nucleoside-diphosphate-sugar epimerase
MKILLTGANGYVGRRLLPELLEQRHEVVCCVSYKTRLRLDAITLAKISIWEIDLRTSDGF